MGCQVVWHAQHVAGVRDTPTEVPDRLTNPNQRVTVRDLDRWVRGLFSLAGSGGLIGGAVAVFRSDNQAGTVALLVIGAIASLLAVVGKVPLRWVIGGNEFDMSEAIAQDIADAIASQVDPAGTAQIVGALAASESGLRSPVANAMSEYVAFEQSAIDRVMRAVEPKGWFYMPATTAQDRQFDGFVVTEDGRRIPVEYKLVRSAHAVRRLLHVVRDRGNENDRTAFVLVASGPEVRSLVTLANRADLAPLGVQLVDANDPHFPRRFRVACEDVLAQFPERRDSELK